MLNTGKNANMILPKTLSRSIQEYMYEPNTNEDNFTSNAGIHVDT